MSESSSGVGVVDIERRLHDERCVIYTSGDFTRAFDAWLRHTRLWQGEPDGFSLVLMRQGLAAAALHMANRPRDEMIGWTLNLKRPPTNLFVTGDVRKAILTGRVFTEGVRESDHSRLFVQTSRNAHPEPILSVIDVSGFDVLEILEQYYARSEQNPARFFELDESRFAMILGLPGVDRAWLASLDPPSLPDTLPGSRPIEGMSLRIECGCSPTRMIRAIRSIFRGSPGDLFRGEDRVEVSCPRCGRRWWVTRGQFDADDDPTGA